MLHTLFYRVVENPLMRRVIRNSGYLFSATGISAGLSFVQGILVARLLGVVDYGLLKGLITFTSVINKFASFRMGELVIKYVGQFTESGDEARAAATFKAAALSELAASFVAFSLVWLLSPLGARYLADDPSTAQWFVLYGLIVLANLIAESSTGLLQIFDRYRRMAALSVVQSLITLSVIAYVYFTGGGFVGVLLAYMVGKTVGALALTIAALGEAGRRWGRGWWGAPLGLLRPHFRELAHFAVSTNISASLSLINKDAEGLWVWFFRGNTELGYYSLAFSLVNLVQMPVSPLPQATYPELSREAARKNWSNVRHVLRNGSILAGGYTLAVSLGLLLLGLPLIRIVYGEEFTPAYPALLIFLAGFLVANTFYWHRTALLSLGRPDFPTKVHLALAVGKVAGILLLVPRYGYLASAGLLAAFYTIGNSVSAWKVFQLLDRHERPQA